MFSFARARTRVLIASTALALGATIPGGALLAGAAHANAPGPGLVINEVYGGGGNSGATLKNDFIELRNTGSSTVSLDGLSLQYRSAGGTGAPGSSNVFALPAVDVPAGDSFLVQAAAGTGGTQDLPTPDATSRLALSAHGWPDLPRSTPRRRSIPAPETSRDPDVVDFVGWGTTSTTSFETAHAPATTNTTSVTRDATGTDTNDNSADFAVAGPSPSACGSDCGATPPPPPTQHTIAEIQGTGDRPRRSWATR